MMIDTTEIVEKSCIKAMNSSNKQIWINLVNEFAPTLNDIIMQNKPFTPHDFDHHCKNLLDSISDILIKPDAYESRRISSDELLILNTGILLHDISMHRLGYNRFSHAEESVNYLKSIKRRVNLSRLGNENFKKVCNIILAHSDPKDSSGKRKSYAIDLLPEKDDDDLKIKVLAGLMRLADELDVSSKRFDLEQYNMYEDRIEEMKATPNLSATDEDNLKIMQESIRYWKKCLLIQKIKRSNVDKTQIELVLEDDDMKANGDLANNLEIVWEVKEKIEFTLKELRERCFSKTDYFTSIAYPYYSVDFSTDDSTIQELIDLRKRRGAMQLTSQTTPIEQSQTQPDNVTTSRDGCTVTIEDNSHSQNTLPEEVNTQLADEINRMVNKHKLLSFGHFRLNMEYCARDWLDVSYFFENNDWQFRIVTAISEHIIKNNSPQAMEIMAFVGLDFFGMLLASAVALRLNRPFTFMVPMQREKGFAPQDISSNLPTSCSTVTLFCDAIATTKTITDASKHIENDIKKGMGKSNAYKVSSVYTIFFRNPSILINLPDLKIYALNTTFRIEVMKTSNCPYKETKCYAQNSPRI